MNVGGASNFESQSARCSRLLRGPRRGFTLIEILLVVVILGILASIVVPQVTDATRQTREGTLKDDLRFLRLQVQVYRAQHEGIAPGYASGNVSATPAESDFVAQMTEYSSARGAVSPARTETIRFGPNLTRMPANPLNDQTSIYVIGNDDSLPQASELPILNGASPYGWIYKPQTQEWMANLAGSDNSGTPYANY